MAFTPTFCRGVPVPTGKTGAFHKGVCRARPLKPRQARACRDPGAYTPVRPEARPCGLPSAGILPARSALDLGSGEIISPSLFLRRGTIHRALLPSLMYLNII